jgi:hypothetical protein
MLYAILCYDDETKVGAWSEAEDAAVMQKLGVVQEKLERKKQLGPVARLVPTTAAVTLRKSGEAIVLDGPFAETKEQLLGFYVIDAESMNEVVEIAKELAVANPGVGAYEIRALKFFNGRGAPG